MALLNKFASLAPTVSVAETSCRFGSIQHSTVCFLASARVFLRRSPAWILFPTFPRWVLPNTFGLIFEKKIENRGRKSRSMLSAARGC